MVEQKIVKQKVWIRMVERSVKLILRGAFGQRGVRKPAPHELLGRDKRAPSCLVCLVARLGSCCWWKQCADFTHTGSSYLIGGSLYLILTSQLWGEEHPYIHKLENFRVPSFPIITSLTITPTVLLLFLANLTLSIPFRSHLFLPLRFSSLYLSSPWLLFLSPSSHFLTRLPHYFYLALCER